VANKELYTEADVRAMTRGSRLVLRAGALATPAALDAAFERGISVVREGETAAAGAASPAAGCGCGSACSPGSCTWSKMLSSDATYVVVVSGGRASVARMTPSGPVPFA
jgi:hypothetical protein